MLLRQTPRKGCWQGFAEKQQGSQRFCVEWKQKPALTESVGNRIDEGFAQLWLLAPSIYLFNRVSYSMGQKIHCSSLLRKKLVEEPRIWVLPPGFLGVTTALVSDFNHGCATRITIQAFCFVIIPARGGWILRQCWTNSFLPHLSQDFYNFQGMMLQMEWQLHCLPFIKHPTLTNTLL